MLSARVRSIDVFRGVTVAGMVIVNNPGDWNSVFAPLLHAEWHGWTPTDLIFPFFLFIVGVSIAMAPGTRGPWWPIVRRTVIISGLGLFLAGFPFFPLSSWRIPGVLQRIALCYLAATAIVRTGAAVRGSGRPWYPWGAAALLLVGYAGLMMLIPVPGGTAGDLSPGRDWGSWLDRALMSGHLWRPAWDPEGVLSTVPAIATTLLGVCAGQWLLIAGSPLRLVQGLAMAGLCGVVLGLAWAAWFPINKSLWTSSYVLFTGGLAAAALACCYWWADVFPTPLRLMLAEPFVALGRNALLLFVLSALMVKSMIYLKWPAAPLSLAAWTYQTIFAPLAPPKVASLLYAAANLAALYLLLRWLHRRRRYFTA